ncbi:denn (aex-3) domain protein [Moniliophthora roreri MCA 2997]|uniref:Denn (Aex-3) domain protein n=1 Tax=Moniliophthora roreri (strain MCA 2997) TaxID=1381753 RepID=V2X4Z0_MONRO|nr:denn (aex-3) domain protein [Moniliophthora roreri MCA 2997]
MHRRKTVERPASTRRTIGERILRSQISDHSFETVDTQGQETRRDPIITLVDEDYVDVEVPSSPSVGKQLSRPGPDINKAARILGTQLRQPSTPAAIRQRKSMDPVTASSRNSIYSTRSVSAPLPSTTSTTPLTSLYVVSGLPKSPQTWTLADPDAVLGVQHSEGAVGRFWRPEVLGSTASNEGTGDNGGKRRRRPKTEEKANGAFSKQEVGKMLSKALKLSFTREVEIIASTLQPASTVHTFTFTLPAPNTPLAPTPSGDLLRASVMAGGDRSSAATFAYPYSDDPFARPSSAYLGPPSLLGHGASTNRANEESASTSGTVTYHGVCLTVWSHADAERSAAIRRTLEAGRSRKESAQSAIASRIKNLRADVSGVPGDRSDPTLQARRSARKSARGPWGDVETDGAETEADAVSESEFEVASSIGGHIPGESTLFLPGDTVFWLPYALTLVSRHPVYDLMRDYLTLSWARFSKDVQSHTLQISKILAYPAPRAGELVRLDASPKNDRDGDGSLEVIARFPGGLDFGRGLVDINFTMWPLFKCLNIDNILTICEIALAPTGRVLFFSRYPAMLGIAVSTIKYLVELRGWNGIALPAVHSRDAKIYIDDPGPWIMALGTEARYSIRPAPEVCVCDLDMNYLSCPSPPPGCVSTKQQREKYRQRILAAFDSHYHPDHSIPSEFKEAFPAGRFRPVCKIQAKRAGSAAGVADQIKPPEWWHSTRVIQAFDSVLQEKFKKPSFFKRISMFGSVKRPPHLTAAEQYIQLSIRRRAMAFVDARDDLETKIGRLSRRLNFLMTESDLWRDKFITFEQYAEKLSAEANQLRAKINKEQRETKRLSGLVTLTATEKAKLQNQLQETETAHKEAMLELEKMKVTMEQMEQERAEMIAEVEAQIEKALVSMTVGMEDSEYSGSRPNSRLSNLSNTPRSRRASDASKTRQLRSFGTESTLAESYDGADMKLPTIDRETGTIEEDEEETTAPTSPKKKRFSATETDLPQDGMNAVDEGISQKSDKIAQKVLEIQQKLETALNADRRTAKWRGQVVDQDSDAELSEPIRARSHQQKTRRTRNRSGTTSSTQTSRSNAVDSPRVHSRKLSFKDGETGANTPTPQRRSHDGDGQTTPEPIVRKIASGASLSATRPISPRHGVEPNKRLPALTGTTDESDTDFQSAYSESPRESYGDFGDQYSQGDHDVVSVGIVNDLPEEFGTHDFPKQHRRDRASNASSRATVHSGVQPSPTFSEDTYVSPDTTAKVA